MDPASRKHLRTYVRRHCDVVWCLSADGIPMRGFVSAYQEEFHEICEIHAIHEILEIREIHEIHAIQDPRLVCACQDEIYEIHEIQNPWGP